MNRTIKTHRYLGQEIGTHLEFERVEEPSGEVFYWAAVKLLLNGEEIHTVAEKSFSDFASAYQWAEDLVIDQDFERIG